MKLGFEVISRTVMEPEGHPFIVLKRKPQPLEGQ